MSGFQDPHWQKILILDFGAQYTQLIGRCIRELGVYCEIFPYHVDSEVIRQFAPQGVILSGSHASVYQDSDTRDSRHHIRSGLADTGYLLRHADPGHPTRWFGGNSRSS